MSVESMFSNVTCCWVQPSGSFVLGGAGCPASFDL